MSLLVQVLSQVRPDDNVNQSGLADRVVMKAGLLVGMEHLGPVVQAGVLSDLLVSDRHEVVGFRYDVVHEARSGVADSAVDEITEISSVFVVSVVNEFHLHDYI